MDQAVVADSSQPPPAPGGRAGEDETPAPIIPRLTIGPETDEAAAAPRRRPRPENPWQPLGIDAGGFRLYPSLTIGAVATSNPLRCNCPASKPATGVSLSPALRLESDWVRHRLSAAANFKIGRAHV